LPSLFAKYIKEREGKEIIEDSYGYATYFFIDDGVYIQDIFVDVEHRRGNAAAGYANQIAKIAKDKGYKKMYGTAVPSAKGCTTSVKVLLAYGFEIHSAEHNAIIFVKGL
jgi:acetyltransferase (GNAT) family protein